MKERLGPALEVVTQSECWFFHTHQGREHMMILPPYVIPWKKIAVALALVLAKIPTAVYWQLFKAYLRKRRKQGR